jgi:Arc/MetJ family transcription regulator
MRVTIDIEDELLAEAIALTGLSNKKAAVEGAFRKLMRQHLQRKAIADLAGIGWEGDLDSMREGRFPGKPRRSPR